LETQIPDLISDVVEWESDGDRSISEEEISTTLQQDSFLFSNLDGVDIRDGTESEDEADAETPNRNATSLADIKDSIDLRFVYNLFNVDSNFDGL
jgi:hypothetical protein